MTDRREGRWLPHSTGEPDGALPLAPHHTWKAGSCCSPGCIALGAIVAPVEFSLRTCREAAEVDMSHKRAPSAPLANVLPFRHCQCGGCQCRRCQCKPCTSRAAAAAMPCRAVPGHVRACWDMLGRCSQELQLPPQPSVGAIEFCWQGCTDKVTQNKGQRL